MSKILKNQTGSAILISDTGISVPASPTTLTIATQDYPLWAASSDIITQIGNGNIIVNDGSFDLTKAAGTALLQGNFTQTDFIPALKTGGASRLLVDVTGLSSDNIIEGTINLFFTNERAQDAVGAILTDTASVDFTYNDVGNTITAAVLPAGVDHNSLQNFVANKHIDHSAVSISPGTGLSGGGDITSTRTLNIANTSVTAGTYGDSTDNVVITVNAQGQLTSVTTVPETITNFEASATANATTTSGTDAVLTGMTLTPGTGTYLVLFSSSVASNNAGAIISVSCYANAIQQPSTLIKISPFDGGALSATTAEGSISINKIIAVTAGQSIDIRWSTSGGTATCGPRVLNLLKIG